LHLEMIVRSCLLDSLASRSLRMPQPRQESLILLKLFGHARSERLPRTFRRPSRLSSERAVMFTRYLIQFSKKRGKFSTSKCKDPMFTRTQEQSCLSGRAPAQALDLGAVRAGQYSEPQRSACHSAGLHNPPIERRCRQRELRGRRAHQRGDAGKEIRCRSSNLLLPAAEVKACAGKGCAPQAVIDDGNRAPFGEWFEQATAMTLSCTACSKSPLEISSCAGHLEQIAQDDPRDITQPEGRLPFNICKAQCIV
jgi:hypothetical protein